MIGAIIGDIIGSTLEYAEIKTKDFPLFPDCSTITDDSILTMAVFCALEKCNGNYEKLSEHTAKEFVNWATRYPNPYGAYGVSFISWLEKCKQTKMIIQLQSICTNSFAAFIKIWATIISP